MPQSQVLSDVIMSSSTDNTSGVDHDLDEEDEVEDDGHLEQSQVLPFSSSCPLTSDRVSLPSMMTSQGCSSGVIAAASSEQPGSNGSGPVDSLEQTPLDISLEAEDLSDGECCHGNDNTELSAVTSTAIVSIGKDDADILSEVADKPSEPLKSKQQHQLNRSGKRSKKKKKKSHLRDRIGIPRTKSHKALTATPRPPCKRSKVAGVTDNIHHTTTLLTENTSCQFIEVLPVSYIDITLEDRAINDIDQQWVLNKDHQPKNSRPTLNEGNQTLSKDHHPNKGCDPINPIFISDSCEELNTNTAELKESSPDILPPTPGREQVESILQRKKLTVL